MSSLASVPSRLVAALLPCLCAAVAAQEPEKPAPYIRTPDEVVERMLTLAGTRSSDVVIDLGSGDGRIVIEAARRFGARGVGVERDPSLVALSLRNAAAAGVAERVRFVRDDVLSADLSQATIVTAYLLPDLMWKLRSRFLAELQPGARVVSHAFDMPGWPPDQVEMMRGSRWKAPRAPACRGATSHGAARAAASRGGSKASASSAVSKAAAARATPYSSARARAACPGSSARGDRAPA